MNWKTEEAPRKTKQVSPDGHWELTTDPSARPDMRMYLANRSLPHAPYSFGSDIRECLETFIARCDEFRERLDEARQEALVMRYDLLSERNGRQE